MRDNENFKKNISDAEKVEKDVVQEVRQRVSTHLKELGQARGLDNKQLAKRLKISQSRLSHLKKGETGNLSPYVLANLAEFMKISIDELITGKGPKQDNARSSEWGRHLFMQEQTDVVQMVLSRQDAVRWATAELGKSVIESLEKRTEEIKRLIENQGTSSIVPDAPNQISKAEIAELEKKSSEVWVSTLLDLPYIGEGINLSSEFLAIEADGIANGRKYRYFVGGVKPDDAKQIELGFMDLIWKEGQLPGDRAAFEEKFKNNVELTFSDDPYRPVFSWALHKLESRELINPWLQVKFGPYIHQMSSTNGDGTFADQSSWIGHMCFTVPGEKIFILMHDKMLTRTHDYFQSEMKSKKKGKSMKDTTSLVEKHSTTSVKG